MKSSEIPSESFEALLPAKSKKASLEVSPAIEEATEKSPEAKEVELKELEEAINEAERCRDDLKQAVEKRDKDAESVAVKDLYESLVKARSIRRNIEGKTTPGPVSAEFSYKDEKGKAKSETIEIDFDKQIESFSEFYGKYKIDITPDFTEKMADIWERNREEISKAIEEKGFDTVIFIPDGLPNSSEMNQKMSAGYNETYTSDNFEAGGSFDGVTDKESGARIILVHSAGQIEAHPALKETLDKSAEYFQKEGETLTITDYFILQRKIFDKTGKHLDGESTWTWLPGSTVKNPDGGSRVVDARWDPDDGRLGVYAADPGYSGSDLGCRLSRCFK